MKYKEAPRKTVIIGGTSYISLPIQWIRTMEIRKGDYLLPSVLENGDLVLRPKKTPENETNETL